jgi:predicted 3-demethylubiquinone-9 3-methyltransferase (glyoxalase superfamily)
MPVTSIYPCLWFDHNGAEVAEFYVELFPKSLILKSTPMVTTFMLNGTKMMTLNGGPNYKVNAAMSFYAHCGTEKEIERIYAALTEGGRILMPLQKYEWSPGYAWIEDKYGVHWQLDVEDIYSVQKVVPCLLFANHKKTWLKDAIDTYTGIFTPSKILLEARFDEAAPVPEGTLLFAQFMMNGSIFDAMTSLLDHDFDFSPGNSFVVECDDQSTIDHLWEHLGFEGEYSMCGWLQDRFGVSWQIVPTILSTLMADPERRQRVTDAFLKMQKFDIEALLKA